MKISLRLVVLLSLGGCHGADDGPNCKLASATYVGEVDLTKTSSLTGSASPGQSGQSFGGLAVFAPTADALPARQPNYLGFARGYPGFLADCGIAAGNGQCCYIGPPRDAGEDSSGDLQSNLSDWNVTVTDESNPDSGGYSEEAIYADGGIPFPGSGIEPLASLTVREWSGGDKLLVQGNGAGTVDTFSGQITTPQDFEGLNLDPSWDGGTVLLDRDVAVTWTPRGASSVTINVLDSQTLGLVICSAPDNGSFNIPRSLLSTFQSGDPGGLAIFRSAGSCAYSANASISLLVQTQAFVQVLFQ